MAAYRGSSALPNPLALPLGVLVLALSAAAAQPAPRPPSPPIVETGSCKSAGGNTPCSFSCPGMLYDFSLLEQQMSPTGYIHVTGADGYAYWIGACAGVNGVTCEGGPVGAPPPVAIQSWSGGPPSQPNIPSDSCIVVNSVTPRKCVIDSTPAGTKGSAPGMWCHYAQGSSRAGTTLDVRYICDPEVPGVHTAASQIGKTGKYAINVTGAHMCGTPPPLSWGSVTLIFFFVACVMYVVGGGLVNVKVRGKKPTLSEAFPQWEQWRELPSLIKDGCAFSAELSQKAYYSARGTAPPLDASLSRRLKDNEGGGDAT